MKRILLLGDSIRLGYERTVRAALSDRAFVVAPSANCEHTVTLLCHFWPWVAHEQPDVIHVNCGLWDTRRIAPEDATTLVPLASYRENLATLFTLIRRHTRASIIWATTTPIDPVRYQREARRNGSAGRDPANIDHYNEAACSVAREFDVPINDLHAFVIRTGPAGLLGDDGIHFTPSGSEAIGGEVARFLEGSITVA